MEHLIADTAAGNALDGIGHHLAQAPPPSRILDAIREAGVVETGGVIARGQPTHRKLAGVWRSLVVSAVAAEPLLHTSATFLEKWPEKAALGILLLAEAWKPDKIVLAVSPADKQRFPAFLRLLKSMVSLETREVEGWGGAAGELILVHELSGGDLSGCELSRTMSAGAGKSVLPDAGVLVESVETVGNIADAAAFSRPVTRHLVACLGEVKRPSHVQAKVGMSLRRIIELCGGPAVEEYRVLVGGPLRACLETDLDTPVTKCTDAVMVLPADHRLVEAGSRDPGTVVRRLLAACSGCGFCTELCPVHLMGYDFSPHRLIREVIFGRDGLEETAAQAFLCTECGICELLGCPKGLSPRGLVRLIKRKAGSGGGGADGALPAGSPSKQDAAAPLPIETALGRKIPVHRILQQLHLDTYADQRPAFIEAEDVEHVELPLGEPAAKPAKPLVTVGQSVREGDLLAEEEDTGARVHASIHGKIRLVEHDRIVIVGQDG